MPELNFETVARRFEQPIADGLIKAWNAIRNKNTLAQVENALLTGGIEAVMATLNDMEVTLDFYITDELDKAIQASGSTTVGVIPQDAMLTPRFRFDATNPSALSFIRNYKLGLIQSISSNTREAVRNGITADVLSGRNPLDTARTFRNDIGLTPFQEKAVSNYRESLQNLDSDALRRGLRDKRFDNKILNAIKNNKPLTTQEVETMANRYRAKYIKFRAETIARTESLRAMSIGSHQTIRQMIADGVIDGDRLRKFWVFTKDAKTRNEHRRIPGMNEEGVMFEAHFNTPLGPLLFPRDPNGTAANTIQCRCRIRYEFYDEEGNLL